MIQLLGLRRLAWMLMGSGVLSCAWLGTQRIEDVNSRIARIEANQEHGLGREQSLGSAVESLGGALVELQRAQSQAADSAAQAEQLRARLIDTEGEIARLRGALADQECELLELRAEPAPSEDPAARQRLVELETRVVEGSQALSHLAVQALEAGQRADDRLDALDAQRQHEADLDRRWDELMGPVVQLAGESSVGSGVLLQPRPRPDGGYTNYLLTAWHVVRDIQGDLAHVDMPVPVALYARNGSVRNLTATLLRFDAEVDAALLEVDTQEQLPVGARLASRSRLESAKVFERIYAVGCPLGNDPIPTLGEISATHHHVDGQSYWMINAATYIGNSGGGIFDAETHELLGIFSKIYNYGSSRPTVVPHMGLVTPMTRIYAWLDAQGFGFLGEAPALLSDASAQH